MTTGTYGTPPPSPLAYGLDSLWRNWTGADGKTEVVDGFLREKWNNYSADVVGCSVNFPYFHIARIFKPTGEIFIEDIPVSWNNGTFNFDEPQFYKPAYRPVSECLADLLSQVKGHDFNLGVELGQMKQTVSLLAENLSKLGRAALALRRGDFATAARCLGASPRGSRLNRSDITGRWLELQYGWLPLVSSCYEAAKAFEALTNGPRKQVFQTARRRKATWDLSTAPGVASYKVVGYVRTAMRYELKEEMSFTRQLGLQDPLSIAWELTPWSFVVDWFYPIGNYLSLVNQVPKLKGRWLVTDTLKVEKQGVVSTYTPNSWGGPNWTGVVLRPPEWRYWMTKVRRTVTESPPEVPKPKLTMGLNSSRRFWNALALCAQRFKSKHTIYEHPNSDPRDHSLLV